MSTTRGISSDAIALPDVPFADRTVARLLERAAAHHPEEVFFGWNGQQHTNSTVNAAANIVARNLRARGVRHGSRVAILMASCAEYLYLWFALAKLGAVEIPINTAYTGELLGHQLSRGRAELVIVDAGRPRDAVEELRDGLPSLRSVLVHPDGFAELLAPADDTDLDHQAAPEDLACIIYTSGTTGRSKGVLLTQHHEVSFGFQYAKINNLTASDVVLNYSPFFHIAGKFQTLACLVTGARMVLKDRLSIERFWEEAREYGVTNFVAIGGVCHMLYGREPRADDADNPVRTVYAIPAPAEIYPEFERRFGLKIVEAYGSTETNLIAYTGLDESVAGTCGRPDPAFEVRIVDEHDQEVAVGDSGEIVVRGDDPLLLSAGYDGLPEATEHAWRGGWFHTGDRAMRDESGRLWFQDRMKDSIRRRGENISSYEVERLVNAHPSVAESAAFGAPAEVGEDDVRVVIVLAEGAHAAPEELFLHYAETMPYHMVPRFIDIVPELPRTPTSKVEKYKLRQAGVTSTTWDAERAGWRMTRNGLVRAENRI